MSSLGKSETDPGTLGTPLATAVSAPGWSLLQATPYLVKMGFLTPTQRGCRLTLAAVSCMLATPHPTPPHSPIYPTAALHHVGPGIFHATARSRDAPEARAAYMRTDTATLRGQDPGTTRQGCRGLTDRQPQRPTKTVYLSSEGQAFPSQGSYDTLARTSLGAPGWVFQEIFRNIDNNFPTQFQNVYSSNIP